MTATAVKKFMAKQIMLRDTAPIKSIGFVNSVLVSLSCLTNVNMQVDKAWICGDVYETNKRDRLPPDFAMKLLKDGIGIPATCQIERREGEFKILGNRTDGALHLWMDSLLERERREVEEEKNDDEWKSPTCEYQEKVFSSKRLVKKFPFQSKVSLISYLVRKEEESKDLRLHTKGSFEVLLDKSTRYMDSKGCVQDITDKIRKELIGLKKSFEGRMIGCAFRDLSESDDDDRESLEKDLTFHSFFGISSVLQDGVVESVKEMRKNEISVKLMGGHHLEESRRIGKLAGIWDGEEESVTNLLDTDPETVCEKWNKIQVICRCSPDAMKDIVMIMEAEGHLCVVVANSTNFAPAMNKASVGIAYGLSATEVCKATAQMLILNDRFATVWEAIQLGKEYKGGGPCCVQ